ncbi:protein EARLY RESPONSIVE TO DEHYDRATION 15-like [Pyrus ussuriensis x Pyrus communis]|uniref:Protein EARLY RESPONSIVE TO DEHYDRATION 15-like n=1 Tax=Pyrus ussuriensis x Pyrus communis TaxID=2448454 RepID=A0A5N5HUI0_9ROSA|nr:protein EARLY RESPONSIVE TO DEHYDRATION 15-like [Pyrus ussuriensis x Pyrus communis]
MALVSGGSRLNPNAPLFIPVALRQVEDFSPEWWQLVTTSTWYHDYWLSQQGEDGFYDNTQNEVDIVADLLPETFDLDVGDDFSSLEESQFEEFLQMSHTEGKNAAGLEKSAAALKNLKSLEDRHPKSPVEPRKYAEKPAKHVSPKCSPRFIQQPR